MIYCNKCGAPLPDGAKFCTDCGAPTASDANAPKQENPSFGAESTQNNFDQNQNQQQGANQNGNPYGQNGYNPNGNPYGQNGYNPNGNPYGQNGYNPNGNPYGQNGYNPNGNPYGQNGYNPYGQNGYNRYNPYQTPVPRPLNTGMLIFTIINFLISGILAIWPLVHTLNARKAPDDYTEAQILKKAKTANIIVLVVGIIINILYLVAYSELLGSL